MAKALGDDSRVFVIDDDASVRQALTSLLQSVGLNVEAFGSPADFFKRRTAKDIAAACLILDVRDQPQKRFGTCPIEAADVVVIGVGPMLLKQYGLGSLRPQQR